ncbi:MAG: glycine zipper 2TM domain-containing protein [Rhodospirillaceae bacterium]|nr:glycine zipper 2TM domain-containing protein [Rhodospirillaceae bacterium]
MMKRRYRKITEKDSDMKTRILTLLVASVFVIGSTAAPVKAASDQEFIGTLIGAAVGGFLGSNVGKGKGQLAATAVGTLLGAGIGNTMATSDRQITNTVYNPQPRVVYEPRPQPRQRVVYVERPVREVIYVKQKPRYRTKYVVVHPGYGQKKYMPEHARAYGWKKHHKKAYKKVYYSKHGYKNVRYVTVRRNNS